MVVHVLISLLLPVSPKSSWRPFSIYKWVYIDVKMVLVDSGVHFRPFLNLPATVFMIFRENYIFKNNLWCRLKFEIEILAILG